VSYCLKNPGAQVALFRRTYKELEDTHILSIQVEVPSMIASYMAGQHNLVFNNGSILMFRYCEKEDDARKYDTTEFDAMLFDELTAFTEFQYTYLMSRCRSTKDWWPGRRVRSASNPLNVGHAWVKNRFVERKDVAIKPGKVWKAPADEGGMTRVFIPAKLADNPTIMEADPEYILSLRALPEEEYRAKALGDWSVFSDQFFNRWRDKVHIVDEFPIPPDWERFITVDYGYAAPHCKLWLARPPGTRSLWVYREQYGKGITLEEQIYQCREAIDSHEEKIRGIILDPSMFAKTNIKGERLASMADDWNKELGHYAPIIKGNNERVQGWQLLREMMDWKEGYDGSVSVPPRIHVFRSCHNTIRTLPHLVRDKRNPEDVNTESEDHAGDALRYGVRYIMGDPSSVTGRRSPRVIETSKGLSVIA
jgi:hypothetical protein